MILTLLRTSLTLLVLVPRCIHSYLPLVSRKDCHKGMAMSVRFV